MVRLALKRMPSEILLPLRERHHLCRTQVTTGDLPRSPVAIVFRRSRSTLTPYAKVERVVPRHAVAFSEGGSTRCHSNCGFAGWYSRLRGFSAIGPRLTRILKSPRYVEARGVNARGRRGDARHGRQALPWLEQRNYAMTTTHQSLITHHRGFRVEGVVLGARVALDAGAVFPWE
jgi:hypothetical protein